LWIAGLAGLAGLASVVFAGAGCAHVPAVGGGGPVFAVSVESIDGYRVVTAGHIYGYSYMLQVADHAVRVWPVLRNVNFPGPGADAQPELGPSGDTPIDAGETLLEADATALKSGILIERSWTQAVVHEVTEEELEVGAAVILVPGDRRSVVAELRFRRLKEGAPPQAGLPRPLRSPDRIPARLAARSPARGQLLAGAGALSGGAPTDPCAAGGPCTGTGLPTGRTPPP
jgi:hypothetical protein